MIWLMIATILISVSIIILIVDALKKLDRKYMKYTIILYIYSFLFIYIAIITHDPFIIPFIGQVSPDGILVVIIAVGGFLANKIYNFFDMMRKDVTDIKNTLYNHIEKCKLKHEELEKRIGKRNR